MDAQAILEQISKLPPEYQERVARYVTSLTSQVSRSAKKAPQQPKRLADEPFVGMWKDRDDMADSTRWVRNLRRQEWGG